MNDEEKICNTLKEFTTCDIADALLNLYKIKGGSYIPNLTRQSAFTEPLVGPISTVLFVPIDDPRPAINYIDNLKPGSVLMLGFPLEFQLKYAPYVTMSEAIYGGLMSKRAQYQGCNGTIVFGRIRDVDEHIALKFPVFSYGVSACSANGRFKPILMDGLLKIVNFDNKPMELSSSGYVICDKNGAVYIPKYVIDDFDRFIEYVKLSCEVDEKIADDIGKGKPAKQAQVERRAILKDFD
ncbi:bifunctional 4-hydroxy-4-methyl-2-oxoglutarate aldolase/oxaloacetate decarboxylase NDAI_0A08330 [Naumovozyma dairenensis CBS 421]|uniref:Uncharacterized protein n=1 Tax=Naumovozyma dairenensis (strain ATCC 10597 / BCRC 20456 / CBS 421 / NBRC 0211 / NRRL Y-12639) TaxID=1071378 RepID=G0W598_NAUDC|nr:hypothetical protein NDAI_0A08330 [Naumovozyma dairenensis CBS 421]CCD22986.1 hypothetical protein NDAI_0A08330 [Naumovozyma dairenensis CBS 421]